MSCSEMCKLCELHELCSVRAWVCFGCILFFLWWCPVISSDCCVMAVWRWSEWKTNGETPMLCQTLYPSLESYRVVTLDNHSILCKKYNAQKKKYKSANGNTPKLAERTRERSKWSHSPAWPSLRLSVSNIPRRPNRRAGRRRYKWCIILKT